MTRLVLVGLVLAIAGALHEPPTPQAPRFEVDPFWPKPLPNHWVMGSTIGLSVDAQDHVWVIHLDRGKRQHRHPDPEVHEDRAVPAAGGEAGCPRRQQRPAQLLARG